MTSGVSQWIHCEREAILDRGSRWMNGGRPAPSQAAVYPLPSLNPSPCEEQLKIADHYSGGELDDALAAGPGDRVQLRRSWRRRRRGAALIEALDVGVAILHNRLSGQRASLRIWMTA